MSRRIIIDENGEIIIKEAGQKSLSTNVESTKLDLVTTNVSKQNTVRRPSFDENGNVRVCRVEQNDILKKAIENGYGGFKNYETKNYNQGTDTEFQFEMLHPNTDNRVEQNDILKKAIENGYGGFRNYETKNYNQGTDTEFQFEMLHPNTDYLEKPQSQVHEESNLHPNYECKSYFGDLCSNGDQIYFGKDNNMYYRNPKTGEVTDENGSNLGWCGELPLKPTYNDFNNYETINYNQGCDTEFQLEMPLPGPEYWYNPEQQQQAYEPPMPQPPDPYEYGRGAPEQGMNGQFVQRDGDGKIFNEAGTQIGINGWSFDGKYIGY